VFIFYAITFCIQEQNVGEQEAVPSLLSPIYNVLIRCWDDKHKTKYHGGFKPPFNVRLFGTLV